MNLYCLLVQKQALCTLAFNLYQSLRIANELLKHVYNIWLTKRCPTTVNSMNNYDAAKHANECKTADNAVTTPCAKRKHFVMSIDEQIIDLFSHSIRDT